MKETFLNCFTKEFGGLGGKTRILVLKRKSLLNLNTFLLRPTHILRGVNERGWSKRFSKMLTVRWWIKKPLGKNAKVFPTKEFSEAVVEMKLLLNSVYALTRKPRDQTALNALDLVFSRLWMPLYTWLRKQSIKRVREESLWEIQNPHAEGVSVNTHCWIRSAVLLWTQKSRASQWCFHSDNF